MAFPCICFQCVKCITLESLNDPECLAIETQNCANRNCYDCDLVCKRFSDNTVQQADYKQKLSDMV